MQVETYECSETAAEPIEACEEAVRLMEELGLEGQKVLVQAKAEGQPARRVPYREMTADEIFAYGVLCPGKTYLKNYRLGPVPLRALQIAAHATSLGFYKQLWVWHSQEAAVPDPVLVGMAPDAEYSWRDHPHILARWGEVLETWPVLFKRAVEAKRAQVADAYATILRKVQACAAADMLTQAQLIQNGPEWCPELKL